jgi:hypothetical protein
MQKSFSGQIVLPAQSATAIPIVVPNDAQQMETKVVLKPPSKGFVFFKRERKKKFSIIKTLK